ncbi:MAG: efflux RND transporter periplasmic adaptor subunit [Acidobacteriota bacterium]
MSKSRKRFVLGGIALIAGVAAVVLWSRTSKARSQEPAGGAEVASVTRRDIGYVVKATGIVKPRVGAEVRVGSRTSGVVRRLLVRIGDQVEKGQLLAEVDDRELDAQREVARAQVASARAALRFADADLERRRELAASALISRSDLEVAERAFAMAQAQAHQSDASLAAAATQLGYSRIVAPIRGVVSSVATQEGETVAASFAAPTFLTLLDLTRLEVWAYVDETDIGRIKVGQAAHFTVDTYPDHEFEGRVSAIYPQAEIRDNVVDYIAVVTFEVSADLVLRPEMTAAMRIALEAHPNVLAVPVRAVRRENGHSTVVMSGPAGGAAPEHRPITTGSRDGTYIEVLDGLKEGEQVIVGDTAVKSEA